MPESDELDTSQVEAIMEVPIGLLLQRMDERLLRTALRYAMEQGIKVGLQRAAISYNAMLRSGGITMPDPNLQLRRN